MEQQDTIYLTYVQWNRLGYRILKGEKSTQRNTAGIATFAEQQVTIKVYGQWECDQGHRTPTGALYTFHGKYYDPDTTKEFDERN
jgi:hypothetical protein